MSEPLVDQIIKLIDSAAEQYYRLILVVAPLDRGKTAVLREVAGMAGGAYINVSLELSRRLLDLTQRQRTNHTPRLLQDIVRKGVEHPFVVLDHLEILFEPSLNVDPLQCLQKASRNQTLVSAWSGYVENGYLMYAEPGHPEYRRYDALDLMVVNASDRA